MRINIGFILVTLFSLLLQSCASITPTSTPSNASWESRQLSLSRLTNWQLQGKIAVQTPKDSGSATIDWTQHNQSYQVSLLGPFGSSGMKLLGRPGNVTLTTAEGKQFSASSPEQLLSEQWGFHLPVSYLTYWVRGLPVPSLPTKTKFDAYHRLAALTQDNWQIEYSNYMTKGSLELPQKITVTSNELKAKLMIYSWTI